MTRHSIYASALLIVLIFNIFRFQLPYIQYVVFEKYIAEELCVKRAIPSNCCKGKCFRDKQISAINATHETENTKENQSNKKSQIKELKEYLTIHPLTPSITELSTKLFIKASAIIRTRTISAIFIPPQF
jgi:hypothetical protein